MTRLFGTKLKSNLVISITLFLITMSVFLQGTQFEIILIVLAYAIPSVVAFSNLINNPEPKSVRIKSSSKLIIVGSLGLLIINIVLNLAKV